jgi:hypothetical protein
MEGSFLDRKPARLNDVGMLRYMGDENGVWSRGSSRE